MRVAVGVGSFSISLGIEIDWTYNLIFGIQKEQLLVSGL